MKRVEEGIVFSNDIYSILKGVNALDFDYRKKGFTIPSDEEIEKVRADFSKDVNRMFDGQVTIFSEAEMEDFLYWALCDVLDYPVVTLDRIYYRPRGTDFFLDSTRLDGSKKLVSRRTPNDLNSVERQIAEISQSLIEQGRYEIVLVDDVVFSGTVLRTITEYFAQNGIRVVGVRACISTEESYDSFNETLEKGLKCGCVLGRNVIDQICERDFYFGIAQSGISVQAPSGGIFKAPYFKPYGDPVKRASIPKEYETVFSNNCLLRSMFLWKCIEDRTGRAIFAGELPEEVINTNKNERVVNILRKGLIGYEKIANRNNGECR